MEFDKLETRAIEEFLLSENRQQFIETLIPGSSNHCLFNLIHSVTGDGKDKQKWLSALKQL